MAKKTSLRSTKRFGTRYGKSIKEKLDTIEHEQRKLQKCPVCNQVKAKRVAAGIYACRACGAKFASRAYVVN